MRKPGNKAAKKKSSSSGKQPWREALVGACCSLDMHM
jgi:hypothetical protein